MTENPPKRYRVVFICTRNSCRSQMAEAFARAVASDIIEPLSGGTAPADEVDPGAVAAMREAGIDISGARPKVLPQADLSAADLIVHMGCGSEQCLVVPGIPSEEWGIDDPAGHGEEGYGLAREIIRQKVLDIAERLRTGRFGREGSPPKLSFELV